MAFETINPVGPGDLWGADDVNKLINNQKDLNSRIGGSGTSASFSENQVLIGNAGGSIRGLTMPNHGLIAGGQTTPTNVPAGNTGEVLKATSAGPRFAEFSYTVPEASYWKRWVG